MSRPLSPIREVKTPASNFNRSLPSLHSLQSNLQLTQINYPAPTDDEVNGTEICYESEREGSSNEGESVSESGSQYSQESEGTTIQHTSIESPQRLKRIDRPNFKGLDLILYKDKDKQDKDVSDSGELTPLVAITPRSAIFDPMPPPGGLPPPPRSITRSPRKNEALSLGGGRSSAEMAQPYRDLQGSMQDEDTKTPAVNFLPYVVGIQTDLVDCSG